MQDVTNKSLAQGVADENGNFEIVTSNKLMLKTGTSADKKATLINADDSSYQIYSLIEENKEGKVLAVKQPVTLDESKMKDGKIDTGEYNFAEVAAIKGQVKFINPDGTENTKIAKVGTDVYLPGFSLVAKTDHDGKFLILYIPAGDYTVRIEKNTIAYEKPVTVVENTTLNIGTIEIPTDTVAPITSISKSSTDFKNAFCVNLSTNEENAKIYFSTDGSNPTIDEALLYPPAALVTCGATANCPICIQNESTTVKYFSVDSTNNKEPTQSAFYFYNDHWADSSDITAPATQLNLIAGQCDLASSVYTCTSEAGYSLNTGVVGEGKIYYALTDIGASAPTEDDYEIYDFPFSISESQMLYYYATDWAKNKETIHSSEIRVYRWQKLELASGGSGPSMYYNNGLTFNETENKLYYFVINEAGQGGPTPPSDEMHTINLTLNADAKADQGTITLTSNLTALDEIANTSKLLDSQNYSNHTKHSYSLKIFDFSTSENTKRLVLQALIINLVNKTIEVKYFYFTGTGWTALTTVNGSASTFILKHLQSGFDTNSNTNYTETENTPLDAYISSIPFKRTGEDKKLLVLARHKDGAYEDYKQNLLSYEVSFNFSGTPTATFHQIDEGSKISEELYALKNPEWTLGYTALAVDNTHSIVKGIGFEKAGTGMAVTKRYNFAEVNEANRWSGGESEPTTQIPHVFGCMAYDELRGKYIYFGGSYFYNHPYSLSSCTDVDSWTQSCSGADGFTSWNSAQDTTFEITDDEITRVDASVSPPPMTRCQMSYNPNDKKTYMYGGISRTGYHYGDIWVYGY